MSEAVVSRLSTIETEGSTRPHGSECTRALEDLMPYYGNRGFHEVFREGLDVVTNEPSVSADGEPLHFKPIEGVENAYIFLCEKYVSYVKLLKTLTESLRRLLHPQKKILFNKFIEGVAIRVVELKCEMTALACTNTHNLTGIVADLGLTPDDLVYEIPQSMLMENYQEMQEREELLSLMLYVLNQNPDCDVDELIAFTKTEQAKRERAREKKSLSDLPVLESPFHTTKRKTVVWSKCRTMPRIIGALDYSHPYSKPLTQKMFDFVTSLRYNTWLEDPSFHDKVRLIQRSVRKRQGRRIRQEIVQKVGYFLKMIPGRSAHEYLKDRALQKPYESVMEQRQFEYEEALDNEMKAYPSSAEADYERWQLKQNLTQWVLELRDLLGKRPLYPEPEIGGCSVLFTNKTIQEIEQELEEMDNEVKQNPAKEDKGKGKEKDQEKGKGNKDNNDTFLWTMPRTLAVPGLVDALKEYGSYWHLKDEFDNIPQTYDAQVIREKVRAKAESTIRKAIDVLMVQELERIRAIDREKPSKADKKKGKNDKGGKSKGKGKKDPLKDYDMDDIFTELVIAGIIIRPLQASLSDLVSGANMNDESRFTSRVTTQREMQMALREVYGIPLVCKDLHSKMPLRNSILMAGPDGGAKHYMVHALARETGATLIDLSPINMVGKYQGKKLETFLLNVLLKLGKLREPTIFLVNECHLLFNKKKARKRPDVENDKPARWNKLLKKLMKKLKPGDRMLLIGCTNEPFHAKTGPMCKLFKDVYLIPNPDYGAREACWQHLLGNLNPARPAEINCSILAKLSYGLTGKDINDIVDKVATQKRLESNVRLTNEEFISGIAEILSAENNPSDQDWIRWFETTPLVKARQEMLRALQEEEEEAAEANKKNK